MGWAYFLLGCIVSPVLLLGALCCYFWWATRNDPKPLIVRSWPELQAVLRGPLTRERSIKNVLISSATGEFCVRLHRNVHKRGGETVILEVRGSETKNLETLRDALTQKGIEYEEKFTPRRRELQRVRMMWRDGDMLVVSAVVGAIVALFEASGLDISEGIIVSESGFVPSTIAPEGAS